MSKLDKLSEKDNLVGKNIPHDSAVGHVSGESIYIDDMPFLPNELIVDFFWSPIAHGKIKKIDLQAAAKVEGVVGLYTAKDLGGENKFGSIMQDENLLAEDVVEFIGHPIVVIAAENRKAIKQAKALINIDIEELPPVLSIDQAIQAKQFIGNPKRIVRGDSQAALKTAKHILEGYFVCGGQDHFYLESQAALVYPGEYDQLVVHSSTQNPSEVQEVIAHVLGLQNNQVICLTKRMGGGFGGKECQATHPACMAALVALKTKRPARIVYNKDDDMHVTGKRHGFKNKFKVGFTDDGLIQALEVDLYSNGGAFNDLSTAVMSRAMTHVDNAYWIADISVTGTVCKTNYPPNTAFRGFGGPQGVATIESIIQDIACYLGKDAYDVRRMNLYGIDERNTTHYGEIIPHNKLPEIFDTLVHTADYKQRQAALMEFNAQSKTHIKGMAMTAVKFGISFNTKFLNQANALVNIYLDGSIQVSTGATEMGQGVNTKIRQLVADQFAIPVEHVLVMITSTEKNNNTSATAASSASDLNGSAAVNAGLILKERLAQAASVLITTGRDDIQPSADNIIFENGQVYDARRPDRKVSFKELVKYAHRQRVNLGERGFYATKGLDWNPETYQGNPFLYYTMGAAVSEVLIDRFTGDLQLLRCDLLMDIGRSINPGIDRGQIVGAFIQGYGWVTNEELRYTDKGMLLTHSPTTYKIPNIGDLPKIFNVACIDNPDNTSNVAGSKAVGEPPLLLGLSVWNAVKNALSYVNKEVKPVYLEIPATGEQILERISQLEAPSKTASKSLQAATKKR